VLALVTVPTHLPLDAALPDLEGEAQSKIEQAKLIGGLRVTGRLQRVRPGQAAQAVIDEARAIRAAVIVMLLQYRDGRPLYGKTLQTVLAKRPARVIVDAEPSEKKVRVAA
jgi:APA family basic amino acid/polyamine antiporter